MKKLATALLLMIALSITTPVWAHTYGYDYDHDDASAVDMSQLGMLTASAFGAGVYLLRRRAGTRK